MRKIILFGVVFVLLINYINADLDDGYLYYTLDDDEVIGSETKDLFSGSFWANNTGVTTGLNGVLEESYYFDGSGDYLVTPAQSNFSYDTENFTHVIWFNHSGNSNVEYILRLAPNGNQYMFLNKQTDNAIRFRLQNAGGQQCDFETQSTSLMTGNFQMLTILRNGTATCDDDNYHIFINETQIPITFNTANCGLCLVNALDLYIGSDQTGASVWTGGFDNMLFYDRELEADEISLLYNSGSGCNPIDDPTCSGGSPVSLGYAVNITDFSYLDLKNQSVNLTWVVDTNSTSPELFLYQDTILIFNTTNETIITNWTYQISGLTNNTEYTFLLNVTHNTTIYDEETQTITTLNNSIPIDNQLLEELQALRTDLNTLKNENSEVLIMLGLLIFTGVLILAGIFSRLYYLWVVSAIPTLMLAVIYFSKYANETTNVSYKVYAWSFLILTAFLSFAGLLIQLGLGKRDKDVMSETEYLIDYK